MDVNIPVSESPCLNLACRKMKSLNAHALSSLSIVLRQCGMQITSALNTGGSSSASQPDLEELLENLKQKVHEVEHWSHLLASPEAVQLATRKSGELKYHHSSELLLQCVQMSFSSRGSEFAATVRQALRLVLPMELWSIMDTKIQRLPTRSTVMRGRFALDMAISIQQQILREDGVSTRQARYWWADASPLRGREWLWLQEHSIDEADLVPSMERAHTLIQEMHRIAVLHAAAMLEYDEEIEAEASKWEILVHPTEHKRKSTLTSSWKTRPTLTFFSIKDVLLKHIGYFEAVHPSDQKSTLQPKSLIISLLSGSGLPTPLLLDLPSKMC